jgi:hypothetical protein
MGVWYPLSPCGKKMSSMILIFNILVLCQKDLICFLKWEFQRFGTLTKFFSGHNFFLCNFFLAISIQPSLYNHLSTTISIQPSLYNNWPQLFSVHLFLAISIQPRFKIPEKFLPVAGTEYSRNRNFDRNFGFVPVISRVF